MNASAMPDKNLTRGSGRARKAHCVTYQTVWQQALGYADLAGHLRSTMLHALGSTLAHQQKAHALQQIDRRVHSLRQKNICLRIVIVRFELCLR